ncbi:uracil-DNA glycosylase [Acholeplasma equifetale]|uniref:uracil-DNA glycosylase n=1 Tax=Acholeplasma equifetale TaxID=264634 RepID=UPI00047B5779|nr:uracil-DNA glycosylase [Acholeplasma equifetale]
MNWYQFIEKESKQSYFEGMMNKIYYDMQSQTVYPPKDKWFEAFRLTPIENVKVVILGQDPYHGENEAHGLAFSVLVDKRPPSLQNIFIELKNDLDIIRTNNNLTSWAKEGVLLLNTQLTVIKDKPNSHKGIGWEIFTEHVISFLDKLDQPICFILWGNNAKSYKNLINNEKHFVIESSHPSPFSARVDFFNSKPFSRANEYLIRNNVKPIDWSK